MKETPTNAMVTLLALAPFLHAEVFRPVWDGVALRLASPNLHFLSGRALEAIRNGRSVAYDFQLRLVETGTVRRRALERFVISYDLWEERFSVARLGSGGSPRKTSPSLTQTLAEAWCLENLSLSTEGLAADRPYVIELDIRAQEALSLHPLHEDGISLSALVEIFSRPARAQQQRWEHRYPARTLEQLRAR